MAGTLTRMPRSRNIERLVLKGLEKTSGNNYLAALQNVSEGWRVCVCGGGGGGVTIYSVSQIFTDRLQFAKMKNVFVSRVCKLPKS